MVTRLGLEASEYMKSHMQEKMQNTNSEKRETLGWGLYLIVYGR